MLLNGFYDVKWSSLRRSEHVSALEIERRRYSKSEIINGKDAVDSVQRRKKWLGIFGRSLLIRMMKSESNILLNLAPFSISLLYHFRPDKFKN